MVHGVLSEMYDYAQQHFSAEEDYLRSIDYPRLAEHELEHSDFIERMANFSARASDDLPEDPLEIHRYLKSWLLRHILKSDMQYRFFAEQKKTISIEPDVESC